MSAEYDVVIVGGGIFGASVVMNASQRGLRACLLEARDFASGTSANSLKTIHGGLRYLQSLDVASALVSSRARNDWLAFAPLLVKPLPCLLPTSKSIMKSRSVVGGGMFLYNLLTLGRNKGLGVHQTLPAAGLVGLERLRSNGPELSQSGLTGAAKWCDAQVDDTERLLISMLSTAQRYGATLHNQAPVLAIENSGSVVTTRYEQFGERHTLTSSSVIDCSANNELLKGYSSRPVDSVFVTGINLVVRKRLVESALGINIDNGQDGSRLMFLSPWKEGYTLVGTWYYPEGGCDISNEVLDQLIEQINSGFKQSVLSRSDIVRIHKGRLPADPELLDRLGADRALIKHAITNEGLKDKHSNIYRLTGTKWTLARFEAKRLVDKLIRDRRLEGRAGSPVQPLLSDDDRAYLEKTPMTCQQKDFVMTYFPAGVRHIADLSEKGGSALETVPGVPDCIRAVLEYVLDQEWVTSFEDFIMRRLPFASAECPSMDTLEYCESLYRARFPGALSEDWPTRLRCAYFFTAKN